MSWKKKKNKEETSRPHATDRQRFPCPVHLHSNDSFEMVGVNREISCRMQGEPLQFVYSFLSIYGLPHGLKVAEWEEKTDRQMDRQTDRQTNEWMDIDTDFPYIQEIATFGVAAQKEYDLA